MKRTETVNFKDPLIETMESLAECINTYSYLTRQDELNKLENWLCELREKEFCKNPSELDPKIVESASLKDSLLKNIDLRCKAIQVYIGTLQRENDYYLKCLNDVKDTNDNEVR